jgi:hypothetical protein
MSTNDPYQQALQSLGYLLSGAAPPTSIPRDFETEQRIHNEQTIAASRRRERDREIAAGRERERKFVEQHQKEMADQQRVTDVLRWHEAEEQDRREFLAAGGFEEEYQFDRLSYIQAERERSERIARRLPSFGAI